MLRSERETFTLDWAEQQQTRFNIASNCVCRYNMIRPKLELINLAENRGRLVSRIEIESENASTDINLINELKVD